MSNQIGESITISGGYDFEPDWLSGREAISGVITKWVPGQNNAPACLVKLHAPLTAQGDIRGRRETRTGSFLVLELRYVGQQWEHSGTVHVELLDAEPPDKAWGEREPGAWVESHATYVIGETAAPPSP